MHRVPLRNTIVVRLLGLLLVGCASADLEQPWDELHAESDVGELELGLTASASAVESCIATEDGGQWCCVPVVGGVRCRKVPPPDTVWTLTASAAQTLAAESAAATFSVAPRLAARAEAPRASATLEREQAKGTILPCEFWPDGSYTCCFVIKGIPICTTHDPIAALY